MPTKSIGTGTRNTAFNAPAEWLALLGQLAGCGNVGKFVREKVEAGIAQENPEAARKLREIRRQYYGAALLVLIFISFVFTTIEQLRSLRSNQTRVAQRSQRSRSSRRTKAVPMGDGDDIELDEFTGGIVMPEIQWTEVLDA